MNRANGNTVKEILLKLSPDELNAVENYQHIRRMPSRSAAIRTLIRRGLQGFETVSNAEMADAIRQIFAISGGVVGELDKRPQIPEEPMCAVCHERHPAAVNCPSLTSVKEVNAFALMDWGIKPPAPAAVVPLADDEGFDFDEREE